jgi:hypothetical protein
MLPSFQTIVPVLWVGHFLQRLGFITSELFYTDDNGTYILPTRDFHPEIEIIDGKVNLEEFLPVHKRRIRKPSDKRLHIPRSEPYMEGHNTWIANHDRSTVVPVERSVLLIIQPTNDLDFWLL